VKFSSLSEPGGWGGGCVQRACNTALNNSASTQPSIKRLLLNIYFGGGVRTSHGTVGTARLVGRRINWCIIGQEPRLKCGSTHRSSGLWLHGL
jgi:hypothetical protein